MTLAAKLFFTVLGGGFGVALAFESEASFNFGVSSPVAFSFSLFSFLSTGNPEVGVLEKKPRMEDCFPTLLAWRLRAGVREGVVVSEFFALGGIVKGARSCR